MNFIGKIPNGFNQLSQSAIAVTVDGVDQAIFTTSSFTVNQTITGSLFGTASYISGSVFTSVNPALSSSYALSSSFAQTSSFLLNNIDLSGSLRLYVSPSGSDSNDGTQPTKPFKTIKAAVASLGAINPLVQKRYTIFVGTGNYTEDNPITVPPGTAIVGDNLRTVRLTAANPRKDYFHCHDSNYFYGLRFIDMQYPSFTFSFPCSTATGSVNASGQVTSLGLVHSVTGYPPNQTNLDIGIIIESPDSITGSASSATANVNTDSNGLITTINLTHSGSNYVIGEKFHVSIPAPTSQQPYIFASPYIQNCSSITGPFTLDGQKIPATVPLPYDVNNILGSSVDPQGAGGGIRIDGNLVNPGSGLQSFVADAFTQVNQGGPGHLVINNGYAQFVSCFTTFCTYGFKVAAGGVGNVSNSVCDFGNFGLISKKNFLIPYNTASVATDKTSIVASLQLTDGGSGYSSSIDNTASLSIIGGGGNGATAYGKVASGSITELILMTTGSGYTSTPSLVFPTPTSGSLLVSASGTVVLSGVTEFLMNLVSGSRSVDISSNMSYSGSNYIVTGVASGSNANQRRITVFPAPLSIVSPNTASFTQLSSISTGGLVMEYVGSGVTYNALPKFGGVPSPTAEINEIAPGKIFYFIIDNIGNLKIGPYFGVNQLTGEVNITTDNFSLAGISSIGPFKRNGSPVGVQLKEVSNVTSLQNSQGAIGQDTVPTQYAVQQYLISQGLTSTNVFAGNAATATTASYVTGSIFTSTNPALSASYAATASYSKNLQISGSINNVDYIDFNTGSTVTQPTPGRLSWNDVDGTLDIGLKGGNVTLQIGQEEVAKVVNKTGGNLLEANYSVVRIRSVAEGGTQGGRLAVVLAQANNDDNSATTLGVVTENIDVNEEGFITLSGQVKKINTTGALQGETWVDGDVLYLSPTIPGHLTNIKPKAPQHMVIVGFVEYAHVINGKIFVKIDNGYEIDELHNVLINTGSLTSGQLLVRSGSVWINSNQLTGSYVITGSLNVTQGITGSLLGTAATASHAPSYLPLAGGTIAGSLTIQNNLTVLGSASIQYISESVLNIGTNIITVNTATPSVRFGGLSVIDSGSSPVVSASLLYDSLQDEFIFVHKGTSTSAVTSSHFVLGPETYNNLGNETYLSQNRIPKGVGNEHLNNSNITDSGTVVSINSNTQVTGSLIVTQGITGSLFGTASYITGSIFTSANPALSASYALNSSNALTASFVNPLNQNVTITGSLLVGTGSIINTNTFFGFTPNLVVGMNTGSSGGVLDLRKTSTPSVAGDTLGTIQFSALADGTAYPSSQIRSTVNGNVGSGTTGGGNLSFWTALNQTSAIVIERMRVNDRGQVLIGLTSSLDTTSKFIVSGSTVLTGSLNVTQGITGSLLGTASNALTASFAPSYVLTSSTSSMLTPYVLTSSTSSMSVATASYVTGSVFTSTNIALSSSNALTASYVIGSIFTSTNPALSASYATSASFAITPTTGDSSNKIATTAFVDNQLLTSNILISSSVSITTDTTGSAGGVFYSQNGRNVIINNGASTIGLSMDVSSTPTQFIASYTKAGSLGSITFSFTGLTVVSPDDLVLDGTAGSTALLTRNGGTVYLLINNLA